MSALPPDASAAWHPLVTRDAAPNPARVRRETLMLDGIWSLSVDGRPFEPVLAPFPPQARVNAIAVPEGAVELSYRRVFEAPADWPGAVLHLEGVDREAEVSLNGVPLGRHAGAWDPMEAFVPREALDAGADGGAMRLHAIEVVARDCSRARTVPTGKQERRPGEGAIFYANMSGIWKSAWIERAGPVRIRDFRLTARASGRLALDVEVAGGAEGCAVLLTLERGGTDPLRLSALVEGGRARIEAMVEGAAPWSPEAPNLHMAALALLGGRGEALDLIETYVGFRDFEMQGGYYRLNGRPFHLRGLLNQAIYPDTLYTPTDAHTRTDIEETRAHGFNGERRHQTTPRHRDLWLADTMGYWLSIEMPSARNLRAGADRAAAIEEWRRIVGAYAWNHPSVFFLVPGNENWGLLNHPHHEVGATPEEQEAFQYELGQATEACAPPGMPYAVNDGWKLVTSHRRGEAQQRLDPSRLMFNVHDYADAETLRRTYGGIARRPEPGSWGANPDHVFHDETYGYDGTTPVMLSEFGGRACLDRPSDGVFAYGCVHRDPAAWASETAELVALMGEMPVVRGGFVLTQTRDAGNDPDDPRSRGEINGILDGHGRPKHAQDVLRQACERAHAEWRGGLA